MCTVQIAYLVSLQTSSGLNYRTNALSARRVSAPQVFVLDADSKPVSVITPSDILKVTSPLVMHFPCAVVFACVPFPHASKRGVLLALL